ncbi:unnamed protein product [Parajaminaea phylloscopi]
MASSQYPFAGTPHAQVDNTASDAYRPYHEQQYYAYPAHSGADDYHTSADQSGAAPGAYRDYYTDADGGRDGNRQTFGMDNLGQGNQQTLNEKSSSPPHSPLEPNQYADAQAYGVRGNKRDSVFSQADRHVFFKRSVPVRALRSICCIVLWTIIIIINVVLLVVLFARPPNVALLSINPPGAEDFSVSGTTFTANGTVNFAVSNPNTFSANIEHLRANLYDANLANKVSIGNGTLKNQKIRANDNTTIVFPFDVGIDLGNGATELLSDVASSCGLSASGASSGSSGSGNLKVLLEVQARISVLSVGVNIPIQKNISIGCPTTALESVLKSITGTSSSASAALASILGKSSSKRDRAAVPLATGAAFSRSSDAADLFEVAIGKRELLNAFARDLFSAAGDSPPSHTAKRSTENDDL